MKKQIVSCMLAAALVFSCGCSDTPEKQGEANAEFWTAPATVKIMQDQYDIYSAFIGAKRISVEAAKNEYESAQIILTDGGGASYTVEVSDLQNETGKIFPKENIGIYHQKYIEITYISNGTNVPTGWYPDALLPYEKAVEYGENVVPGGKNQGIWVTFYVPADTEAGIYEGKIEVLCGNERMSVPVSLTVWDYEIPVAGHTKSIFLNEWSFYYGELDSSQEMMNLYTDALMEYRLAPNILMRNLSHTDADIEAYTELAYRYASNERLSNFSIPYKTVDYNGLQVMDGEVFEKYLDALIEKSYEENFDILSKAVCYINILDEPDVNPQRAQAIPHVATTYRTAIANVVERHLHDGHALTEQILESVSNIRSVVPSVYLEEYDAYIDTWCPKVNEYDTEESRAPYADDEEKWWYTCNYPKNPYPSYHLEDNLLSSRVYSWMMDEYNITGNLYWATNIYVKNNQDNTFSVLEDCYSTAERYPGTNGDGFLFYPGKPYGIEGPVGSIRLHSIRDGLEDYETIWQLRERYGELSEKYGVALSADDLLNHLTEKLYSGTKVYTNSALFAAARRSLAETLLAALSPAGVAVSGIDVDGGTATAEFTADENCVLKAGDTVLTNAVPVGNGAEVYTVTFPLSEAENILSITAETEGKSWSFELDFGGRAITVSDAELAELAEGGTFTETENGLRAELDYAADKIANIGIAAEGKLSVGADTEKIVMTVFNEGEENIRLTVRFKYAFEELHYDIGQMTLLPGKNTLTIGSLYAYDWDYYGGLEEIFLYVGERGEIVPSLVIADVVVYQM